MKYVVIAIALVAVIAFIAMAPAKRKPINIRSSSDFTYTRTWED